jgi:hypothetical protein
VNLPRSNWTLRKRFIHWRLRAARRESYGATLYRRQNPDRYRHACEREYRWTRRWINQFIGKSETYR